MSRLQTLSLDRARRARLANATRQVRRAIARSRTRSRVQITNPYNLFGQTYHMQIRGCLNNANQCMVDDKHDIQERMNFRSFVGIDSFEGDRVLNNPLSHEEEENFVRDENDHDIHEV